MQNTKSSNLQSWEPILAYTAFGWFLGTLVPGMVVLFALIGELKTKGKLNSGSQYILIIVFLCSVSGLVMGAVVGIGAKMLRQHAAWFVMLLLSPVFGAIWGVITGFVGGLPIFVIGGLVGAVVAGIIGAVGFPIFAAIYESLVQRYRFSFWQSPLLAFGLAMIISTILAAWFSLTNR